MKEGAVHGGDSCGKNDPLKGRQEVTSRCFPLESGHCVFFFLYCSCQMQSTFVNLLRHPKQLVPSALHLSAHSLFGETQTDRCDKCNLLHDATGITVRPSLTNRFSDPLVGMSFDSSPSLSSDRIAFNRPELKSRKPQWS